LNLLLSQVDIPEYAILNFMPVWGANPERANLKVEFGVGVAASDSTASEWIALLNTRRATMKRAWMAAAFAAASFIVAGCAVDLSELVPATTIAALQTPDGQSIIVRTCTSKVLARYAATPGRINRLQSVLPQNVGNDPVVQAIVSLSSYVSAQSLKAASAMVVDFDQNQIVADVPRPTITLSAQHIHTFAKTVSGTVLRHTSSTPPTAADPDAERQFWSMLLNYYYYYYKAKFTPYMGSTLPAPALSSKSKTYTIDDTEIVNAVSVFVEFLLDEIFKSPVWKSGSTYYPSGSGTPPTSVTLGNIVAQPFDSGGCGMNPTKADFVRYLANAFSDAAGTDSSLVIKTAGGIDIGFGVLGKVNVGDNQTLTNLVQMAIGEVVSRLTVAFAVPILSSIDIAAQKQLLRPKEVLRFVRH
jgi:hypothetical protein